MDTLEKSPLDIIQQLLAILTTRKESVEKFRTWQLPSATLDQLQAMESQSDHFIAELMEELSHYGDGVKASVERTDDYQELWRDILAKVEKMPPEEIVGVILQMESTLKNFYNTLLSESHDLPVSVSELLIRQSAQL